MEALLLSPDRRIKRLGNDALKPVDHLWDDLAFYSLANFMHLCTWNGANGHMKPLIRYSRVWRPEICAEVGSTYLPVEMNV
jgi:hypothetical protein